MLTSVQLTNFRTHHQGEFVFTKPLSFIVGKNASGKTNLLEALYVNALARSFRSPLPELHTIDSNFFKIITTHEAMNKPYIVESRFLKTTGRGQKTLTINKVKRPFKEVIGLFPVVLFEPTDLEIITAGPEKRRLFLDILLSQANPHYMTNLSRYKRVLRQRNQLLKRIQQGQQPADDLFVYNLQLVEPAHFITTARAEFLQAIAPELSKTYQSISQTSHRTKLDYNPSLPLEKDYVLSEIEKVHERDIMLGYTTRGPHRDHIDILLDKHVAVDSLSRGEIRTLALALKIAELDFLAGHTANPPLLLLDDVLSELDPERQAHLWDNTQKYQTITTTTHLEDTSAFPEHQTIQLGAKT